MFMQDVEELKWRYNIASHPATLVMIPSIMHFVLASIPVSNFIDTLSDQFLFVFQIAVACAITIMESFLCEFVATLLLAVFWIGFFAVVLAFVTFIAEMVCWEK